jgi:hypothetical protein
MTPVPGDKWSSAFAAALDRVRARSDSEFHEAWEQVVARNPRGRALADPVAQAALVRGTVDDGDVGQWHVGNAADFQISARLVRTPASQGDYGLAPEVLASWGEVRVVVCRTAVTAHQRAGEPVNGVRWFLLPLLEQLVGRWTQLFELQKGSSHEPAPGLSLFGDALPAAPPISVRRWVHRAAVSYEPATYDIPPVAFDEPATSAHVDLHVLGRALRDWIVALTSAILAATSSERVERLRATASDLPTFESDYRVRTAKAPLQPAVHRLLRRRAGEPLAASVLGVRVTPRRQPDVGPLRLVFGSMAPSVTDEDAELLYEKVSSLPGSEEPVTDRLRQVRRATPVPPEGKPWRNGQSLALNALTDLRVDLAQGWVDVAAVFEALEITVERVELSDPEIRGVALGFPKAMPVVLLNRANSRNGNREGRRFTLAHELCHVLYDHGASRSLGIADGPWAPYGVEQRANAFAAMFLMPPALVLPIVEANPAVSFVKLTRLVAKSLKTSQAASYEHVRNLQTIGALPRRESAPRDEGQTAKDGDVIYPDFAAA